MWQADDYALKYFIIIIFPTTGLCIDCCHHQKSCLVQVDLGVLVFLPHFAVLLMSLASSHWPLKDWTNATSHFCTSCSWQCHPFSWICTALAGGWLPNVLLLCESHPVFLLCVGSVPPLGWMLWIWYVPHWASSLCPKLFLIVCPLHLTTAPPCLWLCGFFFSYSSTSFCLCWKSNWSLNVSPSLPLAYWSWFLSCSVWLCCNFASQLQGFLVGEVQHTIPGSLRCCLFSPAMSGISSKRNLISSREVQD